MRIIYLLLSTVCLFGCTSLRTTKAQYAGAETLLQRGDFDALTTRIQRAEHTHYASKDRVLYELDLGLLQHYRGAYKESNALLESAEQAMDDALTQSATRAAASMMLNDNLLIYAGEDYENIYVNIFKALNYLALNQPEEAFVEIRRIDEKLKLLENRYWKVADQYNQSNQTGEPFKPGKNRFQNSALGRWLSLLIYRAEGKTDDVRIDLEKITSAWQLQPDLYDFPMPDLRRSQIPPQAGKVPVSFLSLTGQAPEKRADTLWVHTQLDHIFIATSREKKFSGQQLAGATVIPWPGIQPGYTFKLQLPTLKKRGSRVHSISVRADGQRGPRLERIESLENIAEETFKIHRPLIYLKTVIRTVTKGVAAAETQREAEKQWGELYGVLTSLLAGASVAVSENADLRISRFFPAEASVAEMDLLPGPHLIEIDYYDSGGILLYTDRIGTVDIYEQGINLIQSVYLN